MHGEDRVAASTAGKAHTGGREKDVFRWERDRNERRIQTPKDKMFDKSSWKYLDRIVCI